jgi:hypothetical protein
MALARIISHSPQCSQALAASLEERGYAVEIVSPDAIPDYTADLELRVETSPDNVLTARVQTHNGPRSASLDFVHYLNPPMPDFRHRPLEAVELPPPPSVAFNPTPVADASAKAIQPEQAPEDVHLVPTAPPEPIRFVPEAPAVLAEATPALPMPTVPTFAVSTPSPLPTARPEPARASWPRIKIVISRSNLEPKPRSGPRLKFKRIPRPAGWFGRVAVAAAALLLAASLLGLGARRSGNANVASPRQDPRLDTQAQTSQPPIDQVQPGQPQTDEASSLSAHLNEPVDSPPSVPAIDHAVVSAIEAGKLNGKEGPSTASSVSAASSVKRATSRPLRRHQRTHRADLVAPNTITYFDRPGSKPTVVTPAEQRPAPSQKHGGVVAARSVAALNAKSDPKAGSDK